MLQSAFAPERVLQWQYCAQGDYERVLVPGCVASVVSDDCGVLRLAVIVEATYGVNRHEERTQRERRLVETVRGIVSRGGRVLMPVVALGRAQVLLIIFLVLFSQLLTKEQGRRHVV